MGGLDFLNKKTWHTSSFRNVKKVWEAEEREAKKDKKREENLKKLLEERKLEEIKRVQVESGHIAASEMQKMEWMYRPDFQVKKDSGEDYLLGKSVSEKDEKKESEQKFQVVCKESTANEENEEFTKLHEDPLYAMKQEEERIRQSILSNPLKMRELMARAGVHAEDDDGSSEKHRKSKKSKKEKKSKKDKKSKKEKKSRRDHHSRSRSNSRSGSEERGDNMEDDAESSSKLSSSSSSRGTKHDSYSEYVSDSSHHSHRSSRSDRRHDRSRSRRDDRHRRRNDSDGETVMDKKRREMLERAREYSKGRRDRLEEEGNRYEKRRSSRRSDDNDDYDRNSKVDEMKRNAERLEEERERQYQRQKTRDREQEKVDDSRRGDGYRDKRYLDKFNQSVYMSTDDDLQNRIKRRSQRLERMDMEQ